MFGGPRRRRAPFTPGRRVVDAHHTRRSVFFGHIRLWIPTYAHEWPVHAAWLGCTNVDAISAVSLHRPHMMITSWTPTVPVNWTFLATYLYGHPSTRTNGQCKRRGWEAEMFGAPPPSVCTHHTRSSRPRRPPYPWLGRFCTDSSMPTQARARIPSASVVVGKQRCWGDPRRRFFTHHSR